MVRRYRVVLALIASAALAGVSVTGATGKVLGVKGAFQRSITFRWPPTANQTAFYSYRFTSPRVRSITFRSYGATIAPGLSGNQIVACFHRGPAALNWDWAQAANGVVTLRVRAKTGLCQFGPTVANTIGRVVLTIVTGSGAPGPISRGQVSGGGGPSSTSSRVFFYSPSKNIGCEMTRTAVFCTSRVPEHRVALQASGQLSDVCVHSTSTRGCGGDFDEDAKFHELPYGKSLTVGPFRCSSSEAGVTCVVVASGRGFVINRAGVKVVSG